MARPPVGNVPQAQSRTALFAYIAGKLAGVPVAGLAAFYTNELRVNIGREGAEHAAAARRHAVPGKRRRGPTPATTEPPPRPEDAALREWLLVEEHKLDLFTALVRVRGIDGETPGDLLKRVQEIRGVRQVFELSEHWEIVTVVVYEGRLDRERLKTELQELAIVQSFEDIGTETHQPALATWKYLARRAAAAEGFAGDPT